MMNGKTTTASGDQHAEIHLWGGALALDFANTVDWSEHDQHVTPDSAELLADPSSLLRWGHRAGVFDAAPQLEIGAAELERTKQLRDAVHRVFAAIARDAPPAARDVRLVRETYASAAGAGELAFQADSWRLRWALGDARAVRFAASVDAIRLLGDPTLLARIVRCPGRHCGWLFLNTSGRRRWCSMSTCGSREKMRRLYARRRAG